MVSPIQKRLLPALLVCSPHLVRNVERVVAVEILLLPICLQSKSFTKLLGRHVKPPGIAREVQPPIEFQSNATHRPPGIDVLYGSHTRLPFS